MLYHMRISSTHKVTISAWASLHIEFSMIYAYLPAFAIEVDFLKLVNIKDNKNKKVGRVVVGLYW